MSGLTGRSDWINNEAGEVTRLACSIRVGTLRSILANVATHFATTVDELAGQLFPRE